MIYEDIRYIIDNIPFDYSIHMELQLCKLSSQSNKKNSDLLHITSSDTPTESQVSNESAPKKFDTKVETLDQYPNLYKEYSSKNFDYYGITDKTLCPLCKLGHDDEESIEETGNEPWQLPKAVINMSAEPQASDFKPIITFKAKPDPELIIKSVLKHFTYLKF
ncbi:uncharacterized protein OCT59_019540 [Rhizophagus irregularis]|uniref:uncharacterized protein n=1 Tax=Rhizophagus irregularis TaxID=588596 RepID=UPI0033225F03|nr:hypothetical protein OCT59_019540 [Rhizophagus irregularis]